MGCFLGCFGGAKDLKNRKWRIKRKKRGQNVKQQSTNVAERAILETTPTNLVPESLIKSEEAEQLSTSPRKKVTFNSNITTHEHDSIHESIDSIHESIDSQPQCNKNVEKEEEDLKGPCPSHSISEGNGSVTSSVGSYPPNHRYHNARDSDDEAEEYDDGELDDLDALDDEDDCEDVDGGIGGEEVWSKSFLTPSMESRAENPSQEVIDEEVESPLMKTQPLDEEVQIFGSKASARDRSDYVNSVLSPVENSTQWNTAKSKGTHALKPQKENLSANYEEPRISFSSELICKQAASFNSKSKSDQLKNVNQEIAVDASLSNWLATPEITPSKSKKPCFSGFETIVSEKTVSTGSTSVRSFEDRPILGALTMEELKQISVSSSSRKSPTRNPDEMPIIGTVGTYWIHSGSTKHSDSASSYKGIPNTTSKYREDKRVNWHSTPFETRLDRALNRGSTEA